jgi:hypothetical protein
MYDEYSEQSQINIGPAIVAEIKMKELNIIIYAYCTPWNLILATCVVYNVVFFSFLTTCILYIVQHGNLVLMS